MGRAGPTVERQPARAPARRGAAPVQASLVVGAVNDAYELEAKRVADHVVNGGEPSASAPPPVITGLTAQRLAVPPNSVTGPEETDEQRVAPEVRAQRASRVSGPETPPPPERDDEDAVAQTALASSGPAVDADGGVASSHVEASIDKLRSRPAPSLDGVTRREMEDRIGADLGGARVHTDAEAGQAAASLGARAFTVGQDIFFAPGEYRPETAVGRHLIAHELAHTIQQRGGSAGARRVQRKDGAAAKSSVTEEEPSPLEEVTVLEGKDKEWSIDVSDAKGEAREFHVPKLELPKIAGALKGAQGGEAKPASSSGAFPQERKPFVRKPQEKRSERAQEAAYKLWVAHIRDHPDKKIEPELRGQLAKQKGAAPVTDEGGEKVYVVKRRGVKASGIQAASSEFLAIGTGEELARHDSIVRPMLTKRGAFRAMDADHILEDQLGGADAATNLWLLDRSYNRSIGPQIADRIKKSIEKTIDEGKKTADALNKKGAKVDGRKIPKTYQAVLRNWTLVFNTVGEGKFGGNPQHYWTREEVLDAAHVEHFQALTEEELFEQGFKFDETKTVLPTHINVFPSREGGRAFRLKVGGKGTHLVRPHVFFGGMEVVDATIPYTPPSSSNQGHVISTLNVRYTRKENKKEKKPALTLEGPITIKHDVRLGFGGYVSRDSILTALNAKAKADGLSPVTFSDAQITAEGEVSAHGTISSSKALLPGLAVPVELRGSDILVSFPIPTGSLSFGPVTVSEAALEVGIGAQGFFLAGSADVVITNVGQGTLIARVEKGDVLLSGEFALDLTFAEPATVKLQYSLDKDALSGEATLGVKKNAIPGVESGQVTVTVSREAFGLVGSLTLGGVLKGSVVTIGYTPETGLLIEGKDLPLPVDKLPGVSEAKATVRARRHPETGEWTVAGGGQAVLAAAGAKGTLEVMVDGEAVRIKGRGDVAKGPASGWLEITATNQATDDQGNPVEGGPIGDLRIWGKGEASIKFGKILTGTAGLEYTADGRVIIVGEVALPPKFELFPKLPLGKPKVLLSLHPPDFWIWGVKVGPVGFGIFAFVDATVTFEAFAGPGQLLDASVRATLDLDKPEEAKVSGRATFYVPAATELKLDVGGGVKAQVAVAYVKGRVGLDGTLSALAEFRLPVEVTWSQTKGLAFGGTASISASPKFELGVNALITAGVDLGLWEPSKTWGPWRKKLGEFGPDLAVSVDFPLHWSEQAGLSFEAIEPKKPSLDAASLMADTFDTLV